MWPTNWLHRLCSRAPSFPWVQHRIKTSKAGVERLHFLAHCDEGNPENFGDSVSRLQSKCAISVLSKKRWSWAVVCRRCALFTPIVLVSRRNAPRASGVTCNLWLDHLLCRSHQLRCLVMRSPNAENTSVSVYCPLESCCCASSTIKHSRA